MDEKYNNGFENGFDAENAQQVDFVPAEEEVPEKKIEEVSFTAQERSVEPEEKAEEENPQQPPVNPIYSSNPYQGGYYNQSYSYQQPPAQKPAAKKGIKIFAALIAFVVVFSLGAGVATIIKHSNNKQNNEITNQQIENGAPDVDIHESPVSPTNVALAILLPYLSFSFTNKYTIFSPKILLIFYKI